MPRLLYQGHGSYRITTDAGKVLYFDPYVGDGYDVPADVVLITHEHGDHNHLELITLKPGARVIRAADAIVNGVYKSFDEVGIHIEAVHAENSNHNPAKCVGFILDADSVRIYGSGDTSKTPEMASYPARHIDYALLCGDGIYNMNPAEAAECARLIGAKHNILIHMKPGELFDAGVADAWDAPDKIVLAPGDEIELVHEE